MIPCNWLQIMENSVDPVHVEWLHQNFSNYVLDRAGRGEERSARLKHEKIGFDLFEYGIVKRRILEGETEKDEDWAVGHPMIFPNVLLSGSSRRPTFQIRVPMDDTHTLHLWYTCYARPGEAIQQEKIPFYEVPVPMPDAQGQPRWSILDNNSGQDMTAWITQGEVADRSRENLGLSDKGVILYRRLLKDQSAKLEHGKEPMNVFRDPARNDCIKLNVEEAKLARSILRRSSRRQGGRPSTARCSTRRRRGLKRSRRPRPNVRIRSTIDSRSSILGSVSWRPMRQYCCNIRHECYLS